MTVHWDLDGQLLDLKIGLAQALLEAAEAVKRRAIERIQNPPKTGIIYRRGGVEHQASARGESPANDTEGLIGSIEVQLFRDELRAVVKFQTAYAAALEFGRDDGHIKPRPYARPALMETEEEFMAGIAGAVRVAFQ